MRTIVEIPGTQLDGLDRLCDREGISRAEGVRRAVALLVAQDSATGARSAFGLWRERVKPAAAKRASADDGVAELAGLDGLEYQRALRDEWAGPPSGRRRP